MQNLKRTNRWGPCIPNHLCHIHVYVARVHVGTLEAGNPAKRVQMPKETYSRLCVCVFRCCFHLKSSDSSRERSEARLWLQASAPGRAEHRWIQSCVKVEVAVLGSPSQITLCFFFVNTKHPDWRRKAEQGCCQLHPNLATAQSWTCTSHPPLVHFQRQHWGPSMRWGGVYNDVTGFLKFTDCCCCWLFLCSAILHSRADPPRLHVILHGWIAFIVHFWISTEVLYLQRWRGWCHMKLLPSWHILCTPYNHTLYNPIPSELSGTNLGSAGP